MADKKKAKQENAAEQKKANLGRSDVTGIGDVDLKKKDKSGSGGSNYYITNNNNNGGGSNDNTGSGGSGSTSGGSGSGSGSVEKNLKGIMDKFQESLGTNRKNTDTSVKSKAKSRNFDYPRGRTEDGYLNFDILGKQKENARQNLERAKEGNKKYNELVKGGDLIQSITNGLRPAFKKGDDKLDLEELRGQAEAAETEARNYRSISDYEGDKIWSWDRSLDISEEMSKKAEEAEEKQAEILEKIKRGENFQELKQQFDDFSQQMGGVLGYQIDEYGKWAATEGSQNNKYQAKVAKDLFDAINRIGADGKISEDELDLMDSVFNRINQLADEEYRSDKNIQEAEDKYNSAKAKSTYYLLDQIKTWAVFLIGLSQGSPQMVYSAMEQFNKKIADAEADYKTGEIKAFENNNVKDITGQADAQYATEMLKPALDKAILDGKIKMTERAQAVEALEKAFEEYKRYTSEGGHEDFAVWFSSQNVNTNGWAGIIQSLLNAGALNWDTIKEAVNGGKAGSGGKSTGLLDSPLLDTKLFGGLADSLLAKGGKQSPNTKNLRDVQNTVNNAIVASRMGGQKAAPQGIGNAQPVNKSWGFA